MKMVIKILVVLAAIAVAGGLWVGFVLLFKHSGLGFLQGLTFWISHWSFTGWLFFGLLAFILWKLLFKLVVSMSWL